MNAHELPHRSAHITSFVTPEDQTPIVAQNVFARLDLLQQRWLLDVEPLQAQHKPKQDLQEHTSFMS